MDSWWQPILGNYSCSRGALFASFHLSSHHKIPFWNSSIKLLFKFMKQRTWDSLAWSGFSGCWYYVNLKWESLCYPQGTPAWPLTALLHNSTCLDENYSHYFPWIIYPFMFVKILNLFILFQILAIPINTFSLGSKLYLVLCRIWKQEYWTK